MASLKMGPMPPVAPGWDWYDCQEESGTNFLVCVMQCGTMRQTAFFWGVGGNFVHPPVQKSCAGRFCLAKSGPAKVAVTIMSRNPGVSTPLGA